MVGHGDHKPRYNRSGVRRTRGEFNLNLSASAGLSTGLYTSSLPLDVTRFMKTINKPQMTLYEALKSVSAVHLLNESMHSLSGGEIQRVLLARALLKKPELLVLDEPAQGLDIQGQADLYTLIGNIRHRLHCAILMVSHDLHFVMAKTDNVVCLNHHICCSGTPSEITEHPNYLDLFGDSLSPALAPYQHHHSLSDKPTPSEQDTVSRSSQGRHSHD